MRELRSAAGYATSQLVHSPMQMTDVRDRKRYDQQPANVHETETFIHTAAHHRSMPRVQHQPTQHTDAQLVEREGLQRALHVLVEDREVVCVCLHCQHAIHRRRGKHMHVPARTEQQQRSIPTSEHPQEMEKQSADTERSRPCRHRSGPYQSGFHEPMSTDRCIPSACMASANCVRNWPYALASSGVPRTVGSKSTFQP